MTQAPRPEARPRGAAAPRARAYAALLLERVWPHLFLALCLAALFLALAWFGVFASLAPALRLAALGLFVLAAAAILWRARSVRGPSRTDVTQRIERASLLAHQPLRVQEEHALGEDPFARALWREHQARMAARLKRLRGGAPETRTERLDPFGLRAVLALLLVTAFAYSLGPGGGRVSDVLAPVEAALIPQIRVDAWATPPGYTNRAPVFLNEVAEGQAVELPAGSRLSVRVSDGSGVRLVFTPADGTAEREIAPAGAQAGANAEGEATPPPASAATPAGPVAAEYEFDLAASGEARLETSLRTLGRWSFAVVPDLQPKIEFDGEPTVARNGAFEFAYTITEDYGAARGQALVEPREDVAPGARPLVPAPEIRLSMPRRTRGEANGRTSVNIVDSPYAGAKVAITLLAVDDAGQEGRSAPLETTLPERRFANPLARAVVEQRRILALDANAADRVVDMLDAVTFRGEEFIADPGTFVALRVARTRVDTAYDDAALISAVDFLWEIALGIEDGDLSIAERRLRDAQEALSEALENGASEEEIAELMDELRAAMQEFMTAMAEAMRNMPPQNQMQMGQMQEIRPQDLERMMDRIEDLARSGSREAAQELLAELQDMMNNLQAMQSPGQQQQGGQQSQMQQQMDQLGEMLQRQQELMDRTFELGREEMRERMGEEPGENGEPMSEEERAQAMEQLQREQGALQEELQALQEAMEGSGMQPSEGLGDAGEAMGQAEGALGQGNDGDAVGRQGEALEALRRGAGEMMQQMQQAMQGQGGQPMPGQLGQGYGPGQQRSGRDPLGRQRQTQGPDFGDGVEVPDEIDVQRARRILEEIRNRLGDRLSPQLEREYLERLLQTP